MRALTSTALALAALAAPAFAQDATTIEVEESVRYGPYLTTGDGRSVYLFSTDTRGSDGQKAELSCSTEECLDAWPAVTTEGEPRAGEKVRAELLGTTRHEGRTIVTYNGWPLYHFVRDGEANDEEEAQGHEIKSFRGEWYLVTPDGEKLHAE